MKTLILFSSILIFGAYQASSQVVVKVRPNKPTVVVAKPAKHKKGHVWVEGHWRYDKKAGKYVWVKGHWKKARPGHVWVPGHWKEVPGGHEWVPGHWKHK